MEKEVRVFDKEHGCYGVASLEELKNNKLAVINVAFYKNKASGKEETPIYELVRVREVKRIHLK